MSWNKWSQDDVKINSFYQTLNNFSEHFLIMHNVKCTLQLKRSPAASQHV